MDISLESGGYNSNLKIYKALPKIGKTSDYVPLFTIYRPFPANLRNVGRLGDSPVKERLNALLGNQNLVPLQKLLIDRASTALIDSKEYYKDFIKEFRESLQELITEEDLEFQVKKVRSTGNSYDDLFDGVIKNNFWNHYALRSGAYITNLGYTAFCNNTREDYKTLFCFVAKREMIPYLRMCYLMGEEPHPDALELWTIEDLDVVKSQYNIRSKYRKFIKVEAERSGIKIVTWPDLDKLLFHNADLPKFKKLSEKKEWVDRASNEFLDAYLVNRTLQAGYNIKLVA